MSISSIIKTPFRPGLTDFELMDFGVLAPIYAVLAYIVYSVRKSYLKASLISTNSEEFFGFGQNLFLTSLIFVFSGGVISLLLMDKERRNFGGALGRFTINATQVFAIWGLVVFASQQTWLGLYLGNKNIEYVFSIVFFLIALVILSLCVLVEYFRGWLSLRVFGYQSFIIFIVLGIIKFSIFGNIYLLSL